MRNKSFPLSSSDLSSDSSLRSKGRATNRSSSCEGKRLPSGSDVSNTTTTETNTSRTKPPWQFYWKRPELYPVTLDETLQLGHLSILQRKQLAHMTPVDCTSAHLTTEEARQFLLKTQGSSYTDNATSLLQSYDFILVVTILSSQHVGSRSVIHTTGHTILADVVLLEVIVCDSSDDNSMITQSNQPITLDSSSSSIQTDPSKTSTRLVYSKMIHWPGSILNTRYSNRYSYFNTSAIESDEYILSYSDSWDGDMQTRPDLSSISAVPKQPFLSSIGQIFSPWIPSLKQPTIHTQYNNRQGNRYKALIGASLCRRTSHSNEQDQEEENISNALNALHLMNLGLSTFEETSSDHLHQSKQRRGWYSSIDQSNHNQFQNRPTYPPLPKIDEEFTQKENRDQASTPTCTLDEHELLLSCLCNNGKLYFFSVIDLFQDESQSAGERHVETRDQEHSISHGFESLLLGSHLLSQLHSSIIPLTQPKAIVCLSIAVKNKGALGVLPDGHGLTEGITEEKEIRHHSHEDGTPTSLQDENVRVAMKGPHRFLDLESFDATVDPLFAPNRTYNNRATLCKTAFDYIVIGGHGTRSPRRVERKRSSNDFEVDSHKSDEGSSGMPVRSDSGQISPPLVLQLHTGDTGTNIDDHNHNLVTKAMMDTVSVETSLSSTLIQHNTSTVGGFISLISLQHYSEINNFFLPFSPRCIHPIMLEAAHFILIFGYNAHEAVAVHVDAYSEVTCEPKPPNPVLGFSNESTVLRKFTVLNVSFMSREVSIDNCIPIGVSTDSSNETCIVCYHPNGLYLSKFGGVSISPHLDLVLTFELIPTFEVDNQPNPTSFNLQSHSSGGQGWSLITKEKGIDFFCWDGASAASGAFRHKFDTLSASGLISSVLRSSERLTWTKNDYHGQFIHTYITSGSGLGNGSALTLRKKCCDIDRESLMDHILEWLRGLGDYSTLSNIVLHMLEESVVTEDFQSSTGTPEYSTTNSLYDGILNVIMTMEKRRHLSDLAIWALVNLGQNVSQLLERFLERNIDYDPWKAGETLLEVVKTSLCSSLWAVACLLKVGVARNYMVEILEIINYTLPDVIRCRLQENSMNIGSESDETRTSACRTLVLMILESTSVSPGILLTMDDPVSGLSYWDSLTQDIRLYLSIASVGGKCPLLFEPEVRNWAISCMKTDIFSVTDSSNIQDMLPSSWLLDLVCSYFNQSKFEPISTQPNRPQSTTDLELYFEDRLRLEKSIIQSIDKAIDHGYFDFDLIILSLLLLVERDCNCCDFLPVSCQQLLEIVCEYARRLTNDRSPFVIDTRALMLHIARLKNASAMGCLIGGQDGIFLKCVDILHKFGGLDIEIAERYLQQDYQAMFSNNDLKFVPDVNPLNLSRARTEFIYILESNVLKLKKFGDLYNHRDGSTIDPALTARLCFHSLYILGQNTDEENILVQWLRMRLLPSGHEKSSRFSSMAVVRALLWPCGDTCTEHDFQLVQALGIEKQFLIDLCRCTI